MSIDRNLRNDQDGCEITSEITFVWKIIDFSYCSGKRLVSPSFKSRHNSVFHDWHLSFYPRGNVSNSVECWLTKLSEYEGKFVTHLCVYSPKRHLLYREERELCYSKVNGPTIQLATFERKILETLLDGVIVFHCHINTQASRNENPVHCFAETRVSIRRNTFHWKVENFTSLQIKGEYNQKFYNCSDHFFTTFKLFLMGSSLKDASVNIWLVFDGLNSETISSCALILMDENEKALKYMKKEECWLLGSVENTLKFSFRREEITTWKLLNDTLIVRAEVNLSGDNGLLEHVVHGLKTNEAIAAAMGAGFVPINLPSSSDNRSSALSADMLSLFKGEGPPSDFELRVAGRSFPVHQTVLGARSTVFRAMFASDMLETSKRSSELTDVDVDTTERMLLYVYADQEPSPDLDWNSLADLYSAADKYELLGLRKICGDRLTKELDVVNAPRLLLIADRHTDSLLKKQVVEYVIGQGPTFMESENWKKLVLEHPKLAVDVMYQIMKEKWV